MLNIIFLGLVSFFTDLSTEMIYPLIPLYLTTAFGATPALVGVIEGIAESMASLLKVFSGYITDRFQKKKATAFAGYAPGVLYKLALLFAGSWVGILGARVLDRIGKGIRTAPRDVLVSESADKGNMGRLLEYIRHWICRARRLAYLLPILFCVERVTILTIKECLYYQLFPPL